MKIRKSSIYFRAVIFFLVAYSVIFASSYVLTDKDSRYKYQDFFSEKNNFDVLFFGSSHTEVFISPLELWSKYGIISYNFGNPEEGLPVTYWVIRNAIRINKPKIVVLDTYMFGYGDSYIGEETMHYGLDPFPLNTTKINAINDLTKDKNVKLEMICKIGNYHSRWEYLDKSSFRNNSKYMKGNMSYGYIHTTKVNAFKQNPIIHEIADRKDYKLDIDYLERIINLCKAENIELLLITNPYVCDENRQKLNNLVNVIAKENSIPYINMVSMDNILDMNVDMYDEQHVNQSGMHKVTNYIGSYIFENYDLADHRNMKEYNKWDEAYDNYKMFKFESIMWQDDLDKVLMMLHDDDIASYVYCRNDYIGYDRDKFNRLMQNIARNNITVEDISSAESEDINRLVLLDDMEKGYLCINDYDQVTEITETCAKDTITSFVTKYTDVSSDYDIVIALKDRKKDEVRLIQGFEYSDSGYRSNTIYSTVTFKYLFTDFY